MAVPFRIRHARIALGLTFALFATATTVTPSSAATTTPYTATFALERTTQRTCPPGIPSNDFCFPGTDHSGTGTSTPPTPPNNLGATEDFAGFVDFNSPLPNACPPNQGSTALTTG